MKRKHIVTHLVSALLLCLLVVSACAESGIAHESGAWESGDILPMEHAKTALETAQNGSDGAMYEAVAVLGTQVVSGTNICLLCKRMPVAPNALCEWALVYVYEDLEGHAEITDTVDLMTVPDAGMTGAWHPTQDEDGVAADAVAALQKALVEISGADYDVIACLGSQVVAGMNYCLLCRVTPVVPDAEADICLVTVYQHLDGEAEITDIRDLVITRDAQE